MNEDHRPKIRIVEVLVVLALVGVLIGLFLPAISFTNHSAVRSGCQNNLRQLAFAALNFETATERLPANRQLRATSTGTLTVGWTYDLLPYLEQQAVYDRLRRNAADAVANQTRISILRCPYDVADERSTATSYFVNGGCPNRVADNFDSPANGVGDDLAGTHAPSQRATSKRCKDGTSQTIYYVENCNAQRSNEDFFVPAESSHEYFHVVSWLPVANPDSESGFQSAIPQSKKPYLWGINQGDFDQGGPEFARPSSRHPAGFQAAFVGGNIRYLSDVIDYRVYSQLLSSHGARTIDPNDSSAERSRTIRAWQGACLSPSSYE